MKFLKFYNKQTAILEYNLNDKDHLTQYCPKRGILKEIAPYVIRDEDSPKLFEAKVHNINKFFKRHQSSFEE